MPSSNTVKTIETTNKPTGTDKIIRAAVSMEESFCGPIPHPKLFEGYEKVLPGSADRILKMAEKQSVHRQKIENKVVSANIFHERLGILLTFSISCIFIIGSILLIILDKKWEGLTALAVTLIPHIINSFKKTETTKEKIEKKDDKEKEVVKDIKKNKKKKINHKKIKQKKRK